MDIREYVDGLFAKYPQNAELADFKEEVCSNLQERIKDLTRKGASAEDAFKKATAELGDISEIADQISNNKRKEVIKDMYMKTRHYMDKWHIFGYTVAGGCLALGLILALTAYFATGNNPLVGFGSLMPFFVAPVCGLLFLGLTQETARNYPMNWKRALLYVLAACLILFGVLVVAVSFVQGLQWHAVTGSLIPFVLPGAVLLGFLLLTEKSRHKPWVVEQEAVWVERLNEQFTNPHTAARFGLFSGALWIAAVALFVLLGFMIGFKYSWLVFLFAVAAQLLMQAAMTPKK